MVEIFIPQRAATFLGLRNATALRIAPITVDRQFELREFKGANDLFKLGRQARVVLLHQPDDFALPGRKSVFSNSGMSLKRSQFGLNRHTG